MGRSKRNGFLVRYNPPACRGGPLGIAAHEAAKPKDALKALNMAAQQIDKLVDTSAPPEEQRSGSGAS
jgi:hypothetical protein